MTTKKTIKEIKKNNKRFEKLSDADKRVDIAKDVIAQIKAKRFSVKPGTWLDIDESYKNIHHPNSSFKDLFMENESIKCSGCAIGSLMLSATLFNNKTTVHDIQNENYVDAIDDGQDISNDLNVIFNKFQLMMIEVAFEGGRGKFNQSDLGKNVFDKCIKFYSKHSDSSTARLIAIMKNIIKNKGEFKP